MTQPRKRQTEDWAESPFNTDSVINAKVTHGTFDFYGGQFIIASSLLTIRLSVDDVSFYRDPGPDQALR